MHAHTRPPCKYASVQSHKLSFDLCEESAAESDSLFARVKKKKKSGSAPVITSDGFIYFLLELLPPAHLPGLAEVGAARTQHGLTEGTRSHTTTHARTHTQYVQYTYTQWAAGARSHAL